MQYLLHVMHAAQSHLCTHETPSLVPFIIGGWRLPLSASPRQASPARSSLTRMRFYRVARGPDKLAADATDQGARVTSPELYLSSLLSSLPRPSSSILHPPLPPPTPAPISLPSASSPSVVHLLQHTKHEGLFQPFGRRFGRGEPHNGHRLRCRALDQLQQRKGDPRQLHDQVQEACHHQPRRRAPRLGPRPPLHHTTGQDGPQEAVAVTHG